MASPEGVEIAPTDLKFRFQLNKQLPGNITINNTTDKRVAFKIKTTVPKKYVVRPSCGIAEIKSSVSVQVIMQAQKEYPADLRNCKDKFMVQSIVLDDGEELDKDTFSKDVKKEALKEARLRVVLEGPTAPPSPVPEANEHDEEVSRAAEHPPGGNSRLKTAYNDLAVTSQENAELKLQVDKITRERDELRRSLEQADLQPGNFGSGKAVQLSMLHVILIAILAFLVGHYTQ